MVSDTEKLGQLCRIKQGRYLAPTDMKESPESGWAIPVIGGNGVLGYTSRPSHIIDVPLVTCRGSKCGLLQWGKAPLWVSNNAMACDTGDLSGNQFLRYLLASVDFDSVITGSAQPQITIGHLSEKVVQVPSKDLRHAIAEILGSLDDKIALLRNTNATLEAIAQAIFKSWFVDFDPVRAKAEGRDPEGVPPEVADLFPSEFEQSELGVIPMGWRVRNLKDLTRKIGSGATPRGGKEVYIEEGIALVRSQNVYDSEFTWDGLARISDEQAEALSNVDLQVGDVLLNITGASILRTCVVDPGVLPARVNQHVAIIRAKNDIPNRYIHQHLLRKSTKDFLMGMNAGASREAITKGHIESVPILLPPVDLLAQFQTFTEPLFARFESNSAGIRYLSDVRDALLPRLMSGKLRIER